MQFPSRKENHVQPVNAIIQILAVTATTQYVTSFLLIIPVFTTTQRATVLPFLLAHYS
jgi:hypothetical protein